MEKKYILLTGGAGFIGSYVNLYLSRLGYETIVFDDLSRGNKEYVKAGLFIEGNIGDRLALRNLFATYPIDTVFHFAAWADVGESVFYPDRYYENNVVKSLTLLEEMQKGGIERMIFSSSAAIYGAPKQPLINEEHPINPINPYGWTKWMFEVILRDFSAAYGLQFAALRYFNAAGGDPEGEIKLVDRTPHNLIPIIMRCFLDDKPLIVFGDNYDTHDGTCVRDYIHVHDLASAHLLAMNKLLSQGGALWYNLGNGAGFSVKEVIQAAEKVVGRKLKVNIGERRPGDPPSLVADGSKAKRDLGWKPVYPTLEKIISDAWEAHTCNVAS